VTFENADNIPLQDVSMTSDEIECRLADETAIQALARLLAETRPGPAMMHLTGTLGAGKSTLARAFLRTLGVDGPIPSPTYTLIERYPLPGGEAVHLDLYRLADAAELEFLGLDDLAPQVWLVEWPERAGAGLPAPDIRIGLTMAGNGRLARLQAYSGLGRAWLQKLRHSPSTPTANA